MTAGKTISDALTGISAEYIEKAEDYSVKKWAKRPMWFTWAAMAVGLCFMLGGGFLYKAENRYPVKIKEIADETDTLLDLERIPYWEDMEIYDQYSQIVLDGIEYRAGRGEVAADQLGTKLGDIIAYGWDEYANIAGEDAVRYCNATIYEIKNMSAQCAVAVQYEGTDVCYSADNSSYRPATLGQFVEDLDLKNTLAVNRAFYEYRKPIGGYTSIQFENIDKAKVFDLLLSDAAAANEYSDLDFEQPETILDISVDVPILGYENISLSVCEDGYIMTNILSTGKQFFVGEENTKAFVEYVLNECDGYEIVYTSAPDEIGMPE